jgi:hypothetical protein
MVKERVRQVSGLLRAVSDFSDVVDASAHSSIRGLTTRNRQ